MATSSFETLLVTTEGAIATVTINREAARNALSSKVLAELAACAAELEVSPEIRVVVVTGAGDKAFVAGADIAEMAELSSPAAAAFAEMGGSVGEAIEHSTRPWIAMVQGFALGGGCELAMACDFIYASERAKFGQPEVTLGVIPGFGGTQRLARRVGVAKAKELCMTGDIIDAAEALRLGLCDAVVPHDELRAKVMAVAGRIAKNAPLAVAEVKRLVHRGQSATLEHALALEQAAFGLLFSTADQREGMAAFLSKPRREPAFKGR
ncbi:MAG: enoyl-CoA hydratase/isomerase family protein [Myxococcales bacterium]|nr:enoyl-CoA hydratase/isomerase family protein [Myxococcales bacterium]HRC54602.1 enoyl-CoA hydratase-related protein [Kofleriaceae bacterium]